MKGSLAGCGTIHFIIRIFGVLLLRNAVKATLIVWVSPAPQMALKLYRLEARNFFGSGGCSTPVPSRTIKSRKL
jgi:hypothetical protein